MQRRLSLLSSVHLIVALAGLAMVRPGTARAQDAQGETGQPAKQTKQTKSAKPKPMIMTGCIAHGDSSGTLTFTDAADGSKYRLTGANVAKYVGQEVQIIGNPDTRRLHVTGGLLPSPNVAAQAGAIDPVQAAIAAAPGGTAGVGSPSLPDFKVTRVSLATGGECPK